MTNLFHQSGTVKWSDLTGSAFHDDGVQTYSRPTGNTFYDNGGVYSLKMALQQVSYGFYFIVFRGYF